MSKQSKQSSFRESPNTAVLVVVHRGDFLCAVSSVQYQIQSPHFSFLIICHCTCFFILSHSRNGLLNYSEQLQIWTLYKFMNTDWCPVGRLSLSLLPSGHSLFLVQTSRTRFWSSFHYCFIANLTFIICCYMIGYIFHVRVDQMLNMCTWLLSVFILKSSVTNS